MNRQDLRDLNEQTQELQAALDEIESLAEMDEDADVTVDPAAFADAQERAKAAVAELTTKSDTIVDRTDVLENDDGTVRVDLPNTALSRDGSSTTLPSSGG